MEEIREHLRNLTFEIRLLRTQMKKLVDEVSEISASESKISVRTLVVVMILSYILFLGEKVKDLLNADLLKLILP